MLRGECDIPSDRSHEYGSHIIEAIALIQTTVIYGNIRNAGLIDNLSGGCVEVKCLVDCNGVQPCHPGPLPEQLVRRNRAHMTVHTLMNNAMRNHDKQEAG